MEFGKVEIFDGINFLMPPDDSDNARVLQKISTQKKPHIYIGCTGWAMREWSGTVYPKKILTTEYAKFYGKQFSTIEFNTTHYRTPEISDCERWYSEVPIDFKFAPKMLQLVSHAENLNQTKNLVEHFYNNISYFKKKLGPVFIQFPPTFAPRNLNMLETFLKTTPDFIQLAVEVRHPTWFHHQNFENLKQVLEEHKTSFVITDVAGRRDVLHSSLTTSCVLIRFVGNNLRPTDFTRIDAWCQRISDWLEMGLEEVYFFSHQPDNIESPVIAQYFFEKMSRLINFPVEMRGQVALEKRGDEQLRLF